MTPLHETSTPPCPSTRPSTSSPTSPTASTGTRVSRRRERLDRARSGSVPGIDSGSGCAAGSRRWSTVITTYEPPRRVVLTGTGSGVSGGRRHPVQPDAGRRDPGRLLADIRLRGLLRLVAAVPRRRVREDRQRRGRRDAAGARRARRRGRCPATRDDGAIAGRRHRRRRQRPDGGVRAARDGHDVTLFEREPRPGGHVATVTVDAPGGPLDVDTGFIVYNEPTYPTLVGLFARARRRDPAERHVVRVGLCAAAMSSSARAASAASSPSAARGAPGHCGCSPDIARFYRDARRDCSTPRCRPRDDPRRVPRRPAVRERVPRPLPRPVTAAVWSTAPGRIARLPGRLPAALPRQPRPDRLRSRRSRGGRSRAARWTYVDRLVATLPARHGPRRRSRCVAVDPRRGGVIVRTAAGRARARSTRSSWPPTPTTRCALLGDADAAERAALGGFEYTTTEVVLHTDAGLLPRRRAALVVVERRTRPTATGRATR